jgi:argininosuccinate lyase
MRRRLTLSDNILRGSRVKHSSRKANDFTSSVSFDGPLSRHVVAINLAHMVSLLRSGQVPPDQGAASLRFLQSVPDRMTIDPNTEDVHHWLEQKAVLSIGMEAAGSMNLGKSRNDQVATALRMETRERILRILREATRLQASLLRAMARYGGLLIPGYTHLQRAQPTTVFHHLQSYFEALGEDVGRLTELYGRVNLSPMGAAAFAGTSVRVDRKATARSLGFDGLVGNSMHAVSSRGFALESLAVAELLMVDLSRMAEEIILWSSSEFGFIELDDEFCATSSIMPQKKNPVVAETIRAKCGSVIGEATAAFCIAKALPNAYNLDLQEITPHLWRGLDDAFSSLSLMAGMIGSARFVASNLDAAVKGDSMSTATELANELARSHGVPFRQAHQIVGELVLVALEKKLRLEDAADESLAEIAQRVAGRTIKIDKDRIRAVLDALKTLMLIQSAGGANPRFAKAQVVQNKKEMQRLSNWLDEKESKLNGSRTLLRTEVRSYLRREVRS